MAKILEIRKKFPTSPLPAKTELAEEFKACLKRLVAYLKTETNIAYVNDVSKKLPDLENELRSMRANIAEEEKKAQQQKPKSLPKNNIKSPPRNGPPAKSPPKKPDNKEMNELQNQISDAIVREKPNVRW